MNLASAEQRYEDAARERNRLRASASCSSDSGSPMTAPGRWTRSRSRSATATPTRRCFRSATACSRTARASTSTTPAERELGEAVEAFILPVLRGGDADPAAGRRPARASRSRSARRGAVSRDAGRRSRSMPPSAATSDGSSSSPSATRGSRSIRRSCAASAAASSESRHCDGLQAALGLDAIPLRIECFDISTLMGTNTVASMVVFEGAAPKKSDYRAVQDPERRGRGAL